MMKVFAVATGLLSLTSTAAGQFVRCETTAGDFTVEMHREWAPTGFDRFMQLVDEKFFDDQVLYRTIPGFLVQFGVAADPKVQAKWQNRRILDDVDKGIPFTQGTLSFAGGGKNSRTSHVFISLDPHGRSLGKAFHERPIGRIESKDEQKVVEAFYSGYGDITSIQGDLVRRGNEAVKQYPKLDRIKRCYVFPEEVDKKDL
jgi:cyclophilin family peptidyl-prolyl cis-trans isomerase